LRFFRIKLLDFYLFFRHLIFRFKLICYLRCHNSFGYHLLINLFLDRPNSIPNLVIVLRFDIHQFIIVGVDIVFNKLNLIHRQRFVPFYFFNNAVYVYDVGFLYWFGGLFTQQFALY
jgi:hypothetical protein